MVSYNEIYSFNKIELGIVCSLLNTKRQKIIHKREFTNEEIKSLQYRLLLIRHCKLCNGCCNISNECNKMKSLMNHITKCDDINCKREYCVSSRYIINHFYKCNDNSCKICKPVKNYLKFNSK